MTVPGTSIPLSVEGTPLTMLDPPLAPGVRGYVVESGGAYYIGFLAATTPGSGDVGRFLDSLPRHIAWKVPNVISLRLSQMLERRGFTRRVENSDIEGPVVVWCLEAGEHRREPGKGEAVE